MRILITFLISIFLLSCKKKDEVSPTIFEGFENKTFSSPYADEIINHIWSTYDQYYSSLNKLYFRGDGNLYVNYNYQNGGDYKYNGGFVLDTNSVVMNQYGGNYTIDTVYANATPVTMVLLKYIPSHSSYDTLRLYRD